MHCAAVQSQTHLAWPAAAAVVGGGHQAAVAPAAWPMHDYGSVSQGDVHAENVEPLVVLPLEDELSSWSSLSSDSEINQDEEAGPAGHGYGDDDYDLSQPLLAAAAAATAHSAASAPAAAQLEGWPSPHAVVQVDDIQHGQRDVAGDAGAESFVKGQQHVGALQGQHGGFTLTPAAERAAADL